MTTLQTLLVVAVGAFGLANVFGYFTFMSSVAAGHGNSTFWGILTFICYGTTIITGIAMAFIALGKG